MAGKSFSLTWALLLHGMLAGMGSLNISYYGFGLYRSQAQLLEVVAIIHFFEFVTA